MPIQKNVERVLPDGRRLEVSVVIEHVMQKGDRDTAFSHAMLRIGDNPPVYPLRSIRVLTNRPYEIPDNELFEVWLAERLKEIQDAD